jgi:hypothetical protein
MYVPGVMHMPHALEALLGMQCPYTSSMILIWSERMQESTLPHSKYYLLLLAIALAVPWHRASGHD